jgi:hypothetical protein
MRDAAPPVLQPALRYATNAACRRCGTTGLAERRRSARTGSIGKGAEADTGAASALPTEARAIAVSGSNLPGIAANRRLGVPWSEAVRWVAAAAKSARPGVSRKAPQGRPWLAWRSVLRQSFALDFFQRTSARYISTVLATLFEAPRKAGRAVFISASISGLLLPATNTQASGHPTML